MFGGPIAGLSVAGWASVSATVGLEDAEGLVPVGGRAGDDGGRDVLPGGEAAAAAPGGRARGRRRGCGDGAGACAACPGLEERDRQGHERGRAPGLGDICGI